MVKALLKVLALLCIFIVLFVWVGYSVTELMGGEKKALALTGVSIEAGEAVFWGKGQCKNCHAIGGNGSGVRCPNLGVWGEKFPLPIGLRAEERAKEREAKTGKPYNAVDYLIECLANPSAYVVEGYKNEMAVVYAPPISLSMDEIKSAILYLLSQGGDPEPDILEKPSEIGTELFDRIAAASSAGGGDPSNGEEVFFDEMGSGNCAACHTLKGKGNLIGPDLSDIGAKEVDYIRTKILEPNNQVVESYEAYEVLKATGQRILGLIKGEDPEGVELIDKSGASLKIPRPEIKEITKTKKSIMPGDTREFMTVKELQDLTAFLLLQKEKKE